MDHSQRTTARMRRGVLDLTALLLRYWTLAMVVVLVTLIFLALTSLKNLGSGGSQQQVVLVTGGFGFIGSNLVDELLAAGYAVVVVDDASTGRRRNPAAVNVVADVSNRKQFLAELPDVQIDYVVHLAAAISVEESVRAPSKYQRINVEGSRVVLEWAARAGVRRVVAASSAAVYGTPLESLPVDEDAAKRPESPYATTKLEMEGLMQAASAQHGLPCTALRFFNVFGPRQSPTSGYSGVISKFIANAVDHKPLQINGDGTNVRDFVYVKDVCRAIMLALAGDDGGSTGGGLQVFNVGTGVPTTIRRLAENIIGVTDSPSDITFAGARPGDVRYSLSDPSRIRTDLGFRSEVPLMQGLRATAEWYQSGE